MVDKKEIQLRESIIKIKKLKTDVDQMKEDVIVDNKGKKYKELENERLGNK